MEKFRNFLDNIRQTKKFYLVRLIFWPVAYVVLFLAIFNSFSILYMKSIEYNGSNAAGTIAESFKGYLEKVDTAMKTGAATVEYMLKIGSDTDAIREYLTYETDQLGIISETGKRPLFGWIGDAYISGVEWHPNSDYAPKGRIWYQEAIKKDGEYGFYGPYMNLRTYEYVVTESVMLDDKKSVVAFSTDIETLRDMTINTVKSDPAHIVLVMNDEGVVLVNSLNEEIGENISNVDDPFKSALYAGLQEHGDGTTFSLNGGSRFDGYYIVSQRNVLHNLSVVTITDAKEELKDFIRNALISGAALLGGIIIILLINFAGVTRDRKAKEHAETLASVANIYVTMHRINLTNDTFEQIRCGDYAAAQLLAGQTRASFGLKAVLEPLTDERSKGDILKFVDLSTLNDRMKGVDTITEEFLNHEHIWHRARFIAMERDKDGNLVNVLFATEVIDEEKRARDKYQYLAEIDQLTGITNRGSGESKIRDLLLKNVGGVFILFDVDNFKYVNDTFGHDAGDAVLIGIAEAMKNTFRDRDIILRLGGDEFAAYAPGILNEEAAKGVLDRLMKAVDEMDIPKIGDHKITVSIGGAFYYPTDSFSFEDLYSRADTCTYVSKKIKGSEVTFYKRKDATFFEESVIK